MANNVKLFFCGDFCSTPSSSFISLSDDLKSLLDICDLKICNFEGPVKSDGKKQDKMLPHIQQSPDIPNFLEEVGFNVVSLANNHVFDYGEEGFQTTKKAFHKARVVGAGSFEEAYRVEIIEINGIQIGLLALTYASCGVFDDSNQVVKENSGCAELNHLCVNHLILKAKLEVDYLFVYIHDGIEYIDIPLPEQRERYRDLIDYGADGVIAHHAHVPQGWEIYKNKPIFYSLGNFFFNSKETPDFNASKKYWYNGLVVVIEVEGKAKGLKYQVYNILNDSNRCICLDSSLEIVNHTKEICDILKDDATYQAVLLQVARDLWKTKYLKGMTASLIALAFQTDRIECLKSVIIGIVRSTPQLIFSYIRNKNHRSIVIRVAKLLCKYR